MSRCKQALSFETLVGLWAGELEEGETTAAEEHLFACETCSEASDRLGRLVGGLREVIPPVLSHAHRDRLLERGLRIVHTPVAPNGNARARFAPEVDLLVHVLQADLSLAERVDVDLVTPNGVTQVAFEGVPFDAGAGEVLIACQRHYQGMFPEGKDPVFRVHAVEGDRRRLVGDYLVVHVWT